MGRKELVTKRRNFRFPHSFCSRLEISISERDLFCSCRKWPLKKGARSQTWRSATSTRWTSTSRHSLKPGRPWQRMRNWSAAMCIVCQYEVWFSLQQKILGWKRHWRSNIPSEGVFTFMMMLKIKCFFSAAILGPNLTFPDSLIEDLNNFLNWNPCSSLTTMVHTEQMSF